MQASCPACPRGANVLNQDNTDCFQLLVFSKCSHIGLNRNCGACGTKDHSLKQSMPVCEFDK